jgi:hypothetical protein
MTKLTPAAQAVLDAIDQVPRVLNCTQDHPLFAAAALRAAADQVVPPFIVRPSTRTGLVKLNIRNRLQSIADELEGRDATSI